LYGFYHIKATAGSISNFQFIVEKLTKKKKRHAGWKSRLQLSLLGRVTLNQPVIEA
jgi:hypothetical protein